jgi:hypothetical protein
MLKQFGILRGLMFAMTSLGKHASKDRVVYSCLFIILDLSIVSAMPLYCPTRFVCNFARCKYGCSKFIDSLLVHYGQVCRLCSFRDSIQKRQMAVYRMMFSNADLECILAITACL